MRAGPALRATIGGGIAVLVAAATLVAVASLPVRAASPPGVVVSIAGAPLADVAIDAGGVVFASNPSHNEVEVLDLGNDTLEAPIAVGTHPYGLDFSPDGTTLYVADEGSSQVSVIDIATRREVRRIPVSASVVGVPDPAPGALAVADTGTLLVSTGAGSGGGAVVEIDPATGTTKALLHPGFGVSLVAAGDRSRIGMVLGGLSTDEAWLYTAATDSLSAGVYLGSGTGVLAVNATGSQLLAGAYVLDSNLTLDGTIAAAQGRGLTFAPSGSTAYAVSGSQVNVIDTARQLATATLTLPEPATVNGYAPDAVSPDGTTLVVATHRAFPSCR